MPETGDATEVAGAGETVADVGGAEVAGALDDVAGADVPARAGVTELADWVGPVDGVVTCRAFDVHDVNTTATAAHIAVRLTA